MEVRFELAFFALNPELNVVVPWREWEIKGREDAIEYAKKHNVKDEKMPLNMGNQLIWGGKHIGADLNNQAGSSMQVERRPTWMPGPPENPAGGAQLTGPPPLGAGQMGSNIQPPRPPQSWWKRLRE